MARFFAAHPNPWGWDPFVYGGMPAQSLYLPVVHYFIAMLHWVSNIPIDHAYRIVTAGAVCIGPVSVFVFASRAIGSSSWGLIAATAFSLFSPAYGLIRQVSEDRGGTILPWKILVLTKYGEGPHVIGLVLIPITLLALWTAARSRQRWHIVAAALCLAATALINWVASLAMAILVLCLLLAIPLAPDAKEFRFSRLGVSIALAYLLAGFWLTPSLIETVLFNWPADTYNYSVQRGQRLSLMGLIGGIAILKAAFWKLGVPVYRTLVSLGAFCFGWIAVVRYSYGLDTIPESHRYTLEFEMFLILALIEWGRAAMKSSDPVKRYCAAGCGVILLLAGIGQATNYVRRGYADWRPIQKESTAEHKVASWIAAQNPRGRVFASGGLRFRVNSWFDVQQVAGTFETGLRNRIPHEIAQKVRSDGDPHSAVAQMRALGVEYVAVHTYESSEYYRDYKNPERLDGVLRRVYSNAGDLVYRVPFESLAAPLSFEWRGTSEAVLSGSVQPRTPVTVRVNWDPGWSASQDGQSITLERDDFGFMRLTPQSAADITLQFSSTVEQKAMAAISAIALLASLAWASVGIRRRSESTPAPR